MNKTPREPWTRGAATGGGIPLVDEHALLIAASPAAVWDALTTHLAGWNTSGNTAYARLTGASPQRATGAFPLPGSSLPGFGVSDADPPHRLVLVGEHRFSTYVLEFLLESEAGNTLIRARSHAEFPGVLGRAYRAVVIGSGAHRMVVRRLLRSVRRLHTTESGSPR